AQRGARIARHESVPHVSVQPPKWVYCSGLKVMIKFRSNKEGSSGSGNGDALNTAASIERCTAASPLQRSMVALITWPPGIWRTLMTHSRPGTALGGRTQFCSI